MPGPKSKPLDAPELLNYALRALTARALSAAELRARLNRRAANPADIDGVIAKVKDAGFLDDARFAESFAASRRDNHGFGRLRVLRDLRTRRVAAPVAETAVHAAFEATDETALVEQYLARKFRSVKLPEYLAEAKNLAAAYRRLRLAGFSSSTSIRVLKRYAARADELEDDDGGPDEAA